MKADHIKVGSTYSDKKQGLRRVLEIGEHLRTSGMHDDATGVRYEVLMASKVPYVGTQHSMELKSFAVWAKLEVPAAEVQEHLVGLQAEKIAGKLTEPQRAFLLAFDSDLTEGDSVECNREEFRAAAACREKGIIAKMPDRLKTDERYFDVIFSPLGLAVLARTLCSQPA
jgi:hypothetical protein|tara:strand:+ start:48 stop:557 length:510 start_codon:yes stop_codon:yes gene_type:complete